MKKIIIINYDFEKRKNYASYGIRRMNKKKKKIK